MKSDGQVVIESAETVFEDDEPAPAPSPRTATPADPLARTYPLHQEPTDALVVCCADPRFLDAIDKFLEADGVYNPAIIAVPGSVKAIGLQMVIPKQWHTLKHQLELMAQRNQHVPRVILFTHQDCKSYEASLDRLRNIPGFSGVVNAQKSHLVTLASFLQKEYLPSARFELYHASIVEQGGGKGVKFERIGTK